MKLLFNTLFFLSLAACTIAPMDKPNAAKTYALHDAVSKLDLTTAQIVLANKFACIHDRDQQGNSAYHILKAQQALIPLLATNNEERIRLEKKAAALDAFLLSAGCNPENYNHGSITPLAWYSFLNQDIQRDIIVPKYAPIPIVREAFLFNGIPSKYISEDLDAVDLDESDHNSVVIRQIRGNQKIYLKLMKLNPTASFQAPKTTPITMADKTRDKIENPIDMLHNFSTISDQYLHWGKKIHTDDIKNNAWVHLVLSNLKFSVKDAQANIYAILMKAYYCTTATTDTRSFQEIIKTQELHPAALIYLFFDDSNICYHRCLHSALNKDKFEDGFTRLLSKFK